MKLKTTNKKKGKTLVAVILGTYSEYKQVGYPEDPEIYFIRANTETVKLLHKCGEYIMNMHKDTTQNNTRFMGFKVVIDDRLEPMRIVFGPETVEIKWDGE